VEKGGLLELKADKRKFEFEFPNLTTVIIVLFLGFMSPSFRFDAATIVDLVGLYTVFGLPITIVIFGGRKAMKETEILIHGLEQPLFLIEKPRPCSVREVTRDHDA
jgi:hypothetical protein